MNRKTVTIGFLIGLLACIMLPLTHAQDWDISSDWGGPTPSPVPLITASPVGLTEIILLIFFIFFTVLAFFTSQPFLFGLSAFISIITGIDFVILYLGNASEWIFSIVGLGLVSFGIFMLSYALVSGLKNKGGKK